MHGSLRAAGKEKSQGRTLGSNSVLGARRRAHVFQEMSKKSQRRETGRVESWRPRGQYEVTCNK